MLNREQILNVIGTMAKNNPIYQRINDNIDELRNIDYGAYEELMQLYEKMHFADIRELRKYFEK